MTPDEVERTHLFVSEQLDSNEECAAICDESAESFCFALSKGIADLTNTSSDSINWGKTLLLGLVSGIISGAGVVGLVTVAEKMTQYNHRRLYEPV